MTKRIYATRIISIPLLFIVANLHTTHVLWPPERDSGDTGHLLQAEGEEGLARLALRAGLDLVERSLRGGVLLVVMVMVMVVLMIVIVLWYLIRFFSLGRLCGVRATCGEACHGCGYEQRGCSS